MLDKIIEEMEPHGLKVPVLIKKYLLYNAKIIGFNVEPKFNNSIDVLLYIDIQTIDQDKFR